MHANDIHVKRSKRELWEVIQGNTATILASYRLKGHAMALARAVAFNGRVEMIVHDIDGGTTRHARASLTYPTLLE